MQCHQKEGLLHEAVTECRQWKERLRSGSAADVMNKIARESNSSMAVLQGPRQMSERRLARRDVILSQLELRQARGKGIICIDHTDACRAKSYCVNRPEECLAVYRSQPHRP